MFEGTVVEYITAFGGGSITLYFLKSWGEKRKGHLAKKQRASRALDYERHKSSTYLARGRAWETEFYRLQFLAIRAGVDTSGVKTPSSMGDTVPDPFIERLDNVNNED